VRLLPGFDQYVLGPGTWELDGDRVRVAWFGEAGQLPRSALEEEVKRLSSILDRDFRAAISLA
jgi:hypothetical protein